MDGWVDVSGSVAEERLEQLPDTIAVLKRRVGRRSGGEMIEEQGA